MGRMGLLVLHCMVFDGIGRAPYLAVLLEEKKRRGVNEP